MSRKIETVNKVTILEKDGEDMPQVGSDREFITVCEHWNRRLLIVIEVDGKKLTIEANALLKAIQNAQNAH